MILQIVGIVLNALAIMVTSFDIYLNLKNRHQKSNRPDQS